MPRLADEAARSRGSRVAAPQRRAAAPSTRPLSSGRTPPHPGRFLETRFVKPMRLTQTELAAAVGVSRRRINELIKGRRGISPDTAVRLARYFHTDAAFWLQLQLAWDLRNAGCAARREPR